MVLRPWWRRGRGDSFWAGVLALILALPLFGLFVPPSQGLRHYTMVAPGLALLLVAGSSWVLAGRRFQGLGVAGRRWLAAAAVLLLMAVNTAAVRTIPPWGFSVIAEELASRPELRDSVFMIASGPTGEGVFISEVARREARPGHVVSKASKALSNSGFFGDRYELIYRTPEEAMEFLRAVPVGVVILDRGARRRFPHNGLLEQVIAQYPDEWEFIRRHHGAQGVIEVYRQIGHEQKAVNRGLIKAVPSWKH